LRKSQILAGKKLKRFVPEPKKRFVDETLFEDFLSNKISASGRCSIQGIHYFGKWVHQQKEGFIDETSFFQNYP